LLAPFFSSIQNPKSKIRNVPLRKTEQLVAERNRDAYERAGKLLADLREALAQSGRATLVDKHVQKLKAANPTLRTLTSELRRRGVLPK
jgi:uncharacterized Zn finger protein